MAKSNGLQIEFLELDSFFSDFVKGTTQLCLQPREGRLDACCAHGEVLPLWSWFPKPEQHPSSSTQAEGPTSPSFTVLLIPPHRYTHNRREREEKN